MTMDLRAEILKAQRGDRDAFCRIYDAFADKLFRFLLYRVGNKYNAEEILQDTFIKAWKALPKFEVEGSNFSAWMYRIAANTANDYFRKTYRNPEPLDINEIDVSDHVLIEEQYELQEEAQLLKEVLERLPAQYKQVLELRFIQNMTVDETAKIMGRTNLAVRLAQHRALNKLREISQKGNTNVFQE